MSIKRGGRGRRLMENSILNFHLVFFNPLVTILNPHQLESYQLNLNNISGLGTYLFTYPADF